MKCPQRLCLLHLVMFGCWQALYGNGDQIFPVRIVSTYLSLKKHVDAFSTGMFVFHPMCTYMRVMKMQSSSYYFYI